MFTAELKPFQDVHEKNLIDECKQFDDIVLSAPTGAGKTVMCAKFIDDYLDENPSEVFLWLGPGAGGLEKQSEDSFREVTEGIPVGDVYDFINDNNPKGKVFFINWDKINRTSNVVLKEGEQKNLEERIRFCHKNNINMFMVIDEEHKFQKTANEYHEKIQPRHTLRISATPISKGDYTEYISEDEVINAGLIAEGISINEGVSDKIEKNNNLDNDLLLLQLADEKRKEIQEDYNRRGLNIRPLVLIQFPNGDEEWIERVTEALDDMGYSVNSGLVTSWFSGDHPEDPEGIKNLDGQYAFLLFKQAIATGWDCPRAKILVKLRERSDRRFDIQTIGRIRRMPERHLYDDTLLDNCYVYTLDSEFTDGLTKTLSESFYTELYQRKPDAPNIILQKESLDGDDRYAVNQQAVVEVIRNQMLNDSDLNHNGKLSRHELETTKEYVFGKILKTSAIEGVARTTHDITFLNKIFGGEHEIDLHNDGPLIRDAKRKIASAIGIDESISSKALRVLFGPLDINMTLKSNDEIEFELKNKLIDDMDMKEYNAFLVNNRDKLVETFRGVNAEEIADIRETDVLISDWTIPQEQYYKFHKRLEGTRIMDKNVFKNYKDNILVSPNRTSTERAFEDWCEKYDQVEWCYKNGDKGEDFFRIVYRKAFRRNHFYPDYIIQLRNGDIWIIEGKGGMTEEGDSNNIDEYAPRKFDALKEYGARHPELNWGFIRLAGIELYLSNTVWTEDLTNRNVWKPIEMFI